MRIRGKTQEADPIPELRQTQKPIKVVFVCCVGQESSPLAKRTFQRLIEDENIQNAFNLDFVGVQKPEFTNEVEDADYLVPMTPELTTLIKKKIGETTKPQIIDPGFHTISDQYDKKKYGIILQKISEIQSTKE